MIRHFLLLLLLPVMTSWGFAPLISVGNENYAHLIISPTMQMQASNQEEEEEGLMISITPPCSHEFEVTFPTFHELMLLSPGDYCASDQTMQVMTDESTKKSTHHNFQLLLYPRGGGHLSKSKKKPLEKSSFGMFGKESDENKVGLYLQYLNEPDDDDDDDTSMMVDVTFSLQLIGNQASGPKFNVEWSAGMRFCGFEKSNLSQGMANDFGTHVMQTQRLAEFLGIDTIKENADARVKAKVSITVHPRIHLSEGQEDTSRKSGNPHVPKTGLLQSIGLPLQDIRQASNRDPEKHNGEQVRVGKVVVPVLSKLQQRTQIFQLGAYPGVEYRIMQIYNANGNSVFCSEPGADYVLQPIYPLVPQLERAWPVRISEAKIPKLLTPNMYNVLSAIGSLVTAVGGLLTALLISQTMVSLYFIPSKSMDPALQVKNVLVVEKVSPKLWWSSENVMGDVVLFTPPPQLREIVSSSGGRIANRDLFVKRIAAGPGDVVAVESSGAVTINGVAPKENRNLCGAEPLRLIERFIQPASYTVQEGDVFVLGDCSSVSVDSRVWGPLNAKDIVGKPLLRIWPLEQFGAVPSLPTTSADWSN
jgi:signal peptidase I